MNKSTVCAILTLFGLTVVLRAATDESGLTPRVWLKFDGSVENYGETNLVLSSQKFAYAASCKSLSGYNESAYGTCEKGYGSGAWTVVETARLSSTAGHIVWAFGWKDAQNGLALVSGGAGKVWLCTWTAATTTKLVEADVADTTSKFHNYAVVVDPSAKTVTLWVDGATQAGWTAATDGNPNKWEVQFGGVYRGEPTDGVLIKNSSTYHDDWRLYWLGLSEPQIQAIAAAHPVWPDREITVATTLTDDSEPWTGSESVLLRANLTLAYDIFNNDKLANFTGDIVIDSGVGLYSRESAVSSETAIRSPFGAARIVFAGISASNAINLEGFDKRNNVTLSNDIVIRDGSVNRFCSWRAMSGSGCNTTLSGSLSGGGKLTIRDEHRWINFSGDASDFTGELAFELKNSNYSNVTFPTDGSSMPKALVTFDTKSRPINLEHAAGTTLAFGDIQVPNAEDQVVLKNESLLMVGARGGTSVLNGPVAGKRLQLTKVGSGTLTLGTGLTTLENSTVAVTDGKLAVEGSLPDLTVTVSGKGSVVASSETGMVSANLAYAEGSQVEIPQEECPGRTYPIITVAPGFTSSGRPAVANAKGRWKTSWTANEDGSSTLWAWKVGGLVIMLR